MQVLGSLLLFVLLAGTAAYAQDAGGTSPQPSQRKHHRQRSASHRAGIKPRAPLPLEESAEEIKSARPEITAGTLASDMQVVTDSAPAIRGIFRERGFYYREADAATLHGWEQLRLRHLAPTATLSSEMLIKYVSGFGKLVVKSTPIGAAIELDGEMLPEKTETVTWPSAGVHQLKISMDGYEPLEDTCTIEEGKPTVVERTLKPVPSNPQPHRSRKPRG